VDFIYCTLHRIVWNVKPDINSGSVVITSYMREMNQDILEISTVVIGNLMRQLRMSSESTGSAKSTMAAIMPEVTLYKLTVDKLALKFQRLHLCFKANTH